MKSKTATTATKTTTRKPISEETRAKLRAAAAKRNGKKVVEVARPDPFQEREELPEVVESNPSQALSDAINASDNVDMSFAEAVAAAGDGVALATLDEVRGALEPVAKAAFRQWSRESKTADINNYADKFIPSLSALGATLVKMEKRPFGLIFELAGDHYRLRYNTEKYEINAA